MPCFVLSHKPAETLLIGRMLPLAFCHYIQLYLTRVPSHAPPKPSHARRPQSQIAMLVFLMMFTHWRTAWLSPSARLNQPTSRMSGTKTVVAPSAVWMGSNITGGVTAPMKDAPSRLPCRVVSKTTQIGRFCNPGLAGQRPKRPGNSLRLPAQVLRVCYACLTTVMLCYTRFALPGHIMLFMSPKFSEGT